MSFQNIDNVHFQLFIFICRRLVLSVSLILSLQQVLDFLSGGFVVSLVRVTKFIKVDRLLVGNVR